MKKEKGFTLAEMLIVIAVIGVVAAITLPAFKHNMAERQNAARLLKAKNIIENAISNAMIDENVDNINDLLCEKVLCVTEDDDDGLVIDPTGKNGQIKGNWEEDNGNYIVTTDDGIGMKFYCSSQRGGMDGFSVLGPAVQVFTTGERTQEEKNNGFYNRLDVDAFYFNIATNGGITTTSTEGNRLLKLAGK